VIPGPGVALLLGPGGAPDGVPFGLPLRLIGPGNLYIEDARQLYPPLPADSRRMTFGELDSEAVVVTQQRSYRFDLDLLVPSWALWAGEAPAIQTGVKGEQLQQLAKLAAVLRPKAAKAPAALPKAAAVAKPATDTAELITEAMEARLAGDLVRAAELLEAAGDYGGAGRLYEQAARSH